MAQHNELGKKGEQDAVEYLQAKGYEILARNFTYNKGEIDIVTRKGKIIGIVEVKTRSTSEFGDPQDFVNKKKINKLLETANYFISLLEDADDYEIRFDIIAIVENKLGKRVEHLPDAFYYF